MKWLTIIKFCSVKDILSFGDELREDEFVREEGKIKDDWEKVRAIPKTIEIGNQIYKT